MYPLLGERAHAMKAGAVKQERLAGVRWWKILNVRLSSVAFNPVNQGEQVSDILMEVTLH